MNAVVTLALYFAFVLAAAGCIGADDAHRADPLTPALGDAATEDDADAAAGLEPYDPKPCAFIECEGAAQPGAYDCRGDELVKCADGEWVVVVDCTTTRSTFDGPEHVCRCTPGCYTQQANCTYAAKSCDGYSEY